MAKRLWHQSVTELRTDNAYSITMARLARRALGETATVENFGLPAGTYGGKAVSPSLGNAFLYHRILDHIIDQAIRAQRQGFDAFVIGSFSEPFLMEIRSAVDIPVTSILEASLLAGCSLGSKLGFITTSPDVTGMVQKAVPLHGLEKRVASVLSLEPKFETVALHASFQQPDAIMASFNEAADRAIAAGADVIIPAEGIICALVTDLGVTRHRDAPVMDVFGTTWLYARMLAELQERSGQKVTRRGRYTPPDPDLFTRYAAAALEDRA